MRSLHHNNCLHRIERWTGTYFERAQLWEVGAGIVVPHHNRPTQCPSMEFQLTYLKSVQEVKDHNEQQELNSNRFSEPVPSSAPTGNNPQKAVDLFDKEDYIVNEPPDDAGDKDIPEEEDFLPDNPEPTINWVQLCNTMELSHIGNSSNSFSRLSSDHLVKLADDPHLGVQGTAASLNAGVPTVNSAAVSRGIESPRTTQFIRSTNDITVSSESVPAVAYNSTFGTSAEAS